MIITGITDIAEALKLGNSSKNSVKDGYKLLENEANPVFKTFLHLRKKKYPNLKSTHLNVIILTAEYKGLALIWKESGLKFRSSTNIFLYNNFVSYLL